MADILVKNAEERLAKGVVMSQGKELEKEEKFSSFCKDNKIGEESIRWNVLGDKAVKVSVNESDIKSGGWEIISIAINFALRELGSGLDLTLREGPDGLDVIVEK
jgi:hypothetical protein